jgi:hypothetical protein
MKLLEKKNYLWRSVILINVYVFVRRAKICISVSITTESPSSFDTLVEIGESGHKYSVISILRLCDALKRFRFREVYSVQWALIHCIDIILSHRV